MLVVSNRLRLLSEILCIYEHFIYYENPRSNDVQNEFPSFQRKVSLFLGLISITSDSKDSRVLGLCIQLLILALNNIVDHASGVSCKK